MTYKKYIIFCVVISLLLQFIPKHVGHASISSYSKLENKKVALIYSGDNEETIANVHLLDSTLSGMFTEVEVVPLSLLDSVMLDGIDIVVFYASEKRIEQKDVEILKHFDGIVMGIGTGATELPQFSQWKFKNHVTIHRLDEQPLEHSLKVLNVKATDETEVFLSGQKLGTDVPIILKKKNHIFINVNNLNIDVNYKIFKYFYELFELDAPQFHPAYLRLEDISPASDPELVLETGLYLLERGIPVYLAVIPVYLNPDTGEKYTINDTPRLKQALHELVAKGAYVISHGYTHTYRYTETGEGFEFWDSVVNQPITTLDPIEEVDIIKREDQFSNKDDYETYFNSIQAIETEYVRSKLENSIHSLVSWGLPPIGFEPPHYTMSRNGYQITSTYFSAFFGQLQASDSNWQVMVSPFYISNPSLLHGMTLYPETIGFVDPSYPDPIGEVETRLHQVLEVPGSVIGGFYHPYLGLDYLKEYIKLLEKVPNLKWIDIAEDQHQVTTDFVHIGFSNDGELIVYEDMSWKMKIGTYFKNHMFDSILWLLVLITVCFVSLFVLYIVRLRVQYRKLLFKERT